MCTFKSFNLFKNIFISSDQLKVTYFYNMFFVIYSVLF